MVVKGHKELNVSQRECKGQRMPEYAGKRRSQCGEEEIEDSKFKNSCGRLARQEEYCLDQGGKQECGNGMSQNNN